MTQDDGTQIQDEPASREYWWRGLQSVGALALAIVFGALVYLVAESNTERDAAAQSERRSYETIMLTRNVDGSIARSEAALGRFVINSDRGLGTIYRDEWRSARRQITQLRRLIREDPEQASRIDQLEIEFAAYGRELSNTASYAVAERNWEALSLHNSAAGSEAGSKITRLLNEIAANERIVLSTRSDARIAATERSNLLAMLMTVAGIILGIAALFLAWATIRAFGDRNTAHRRVDNLEDAVAARTVELEDLNTELRAEASERAIAEQRLRQAQKMEAVGQLTGGIAHDFNNMLSVVVGGLELSKRKLANGNTNITRHLETATDGADRAAALTRRLLAFARAEPLIPEGTSVAALLQGMEDLLSRTIGERMIVSIDAPDGVWPVWVDQRQLENAILNLAVNARDAMDGEGELVILLENCSLHDKEIGDSKAGDYIRLAVTDGGSGMAPEVVERVFEPFFTTKPVGKGTGLGLSQIFGFARQSGGEIGIDTAVGKGTTVSIYLPRFTGAMGTESSAQEHIEPTETFDRLGSKTILLVEDDNRVRRATEEALVELGADVISCTDAKTALEELESPVTIDLLLTDVVMPGMTGPELAATVQQRWPTLPIIFVTGYVGEAGTADDLGERFVLRKPFTMAELSAALNATFEEQQEPELAAE